MPIKVDVIDGRLEDAIRKLKKKMEAAKIIEEYKQRQYFIKPSLAKREKRKARRKYG